MQHFPGKGERGGFLRKNQVNWCCYNAEEGWTDDLQRTNMCILGIQGNVVTAEAYISNGMPVLRSWGCRTPPVKEARERVRAAVRSSGMNFPVSRITVNLAPASLKKSGTHFDLPILLAILAASGQVRRPRAGLRIPGRGGAGRHGCAGCPAYCPWCWAAKREGIRSVFVPGGECRPRPPWPTAPPSIQSPASASWRTG